MSSDETALNILVVRLGAMGDVIHALPAVAALKHSFPSSAITWVVDTSWVSLLKDNPYLDSVVPFDRKHPGSWWATARELRRKRFGLALDFQGLVKSALIATAASPDRILGFSRFEVRERAASLFYSQTVEAGLVHAVDRNLALVKALGGCQERREFPLPAGFPEGDLPRRWLCSGQPSCRLGKQTVASRILRGTGAKAGYAYGAERAASSARRLGIRSWNPDPHQRD